jgi:hypothetical protein
MSDMSFQVSSADTTMRAAKAAESVDGGEAVGIPSLRRRSADWPQP